MIFCCNLKQRCSLAVQRKAGYWQHRAVVVSYSCLISVPNELMGKHVHTLTIVSLDCPCLHLVSIKVNPQTKAFIRIPMRWKVCETEALPKMIKLSSLCSISPIHPSSSVWTTSSQTAVCADSKWMTESLSPSPSLPFSLSLTLWNDQPTALQ